MALQTTRNTDRTPHSARGRIHPEMLEICLRALAADPSKRYQSTKEFAQALQHFSEHAASALACQAGFRDLQQAHSTPTYASYQQAIEHFHRSLDLWPENPQAQRGVTEAKEHLAENALNQGDLQLASAQLDGIPAQSADHLRVRIEHAQLTRLRLNKRSKIVRWSLIALLLAAGVGAWSYQHTPRITCCVLGTSRHHYPIH